ncbi:dihydroxy-acid dehydratase [Tyzzerella sp. An114]|uniref:dihydroxy-acid dehydratase n=1 Tax=Tyzzerella sp. An114 TaxID=1965545 RepID=UPI000B43AACB|nr:dihydroxy-acid dehydratase [Tyzzerella sp. An114]OUQ55941.1 dihydroxy-acid dehydratase [Tyzzerella sp. An114]
MIRAIDKLEPFQRAISKAHLASAGIDIDALDYKPLVAIANSWNEICPGHEPLKQLAQEVKKGILEAGGEPIEFNTIAMCDGIAQGHSGMRYCLPHREIVTDSIEAMVIGEGVFDAVVFMASCDKIVPAMLNAAARINLPSIIVTAGPCFAVIKPNESKELRQRFIRGEVTERDVIEGTLKYYTGPGVCPFLGTANTMGALCESLGMMLPGGSLIPASTSMRRFSARESGRMVMELYKKQILPSQIMTKEAFENTVRLLSAIGGSLNALIHLPALAAELGLKLDWDDISKITSTTPVLTDIVPNGNKTVVDLHYAGGIPSVLKELKSVLNLDCITVTGNTLRENLEKAVDGNRDIIRIIKNPIAKADGIQVLYGNLAPNGALVKTSAVPEEVRVFYGTAKVFNSEDECYAAFREKEIKEGDAVIVRYEGPKGGPGMKELHRITEIIKGIPRTAVITDGRFSGASGGLSIGYLCPEAEEGGPIALVENGDKIYINLADNAINLEVSDEILEERRKNWHPPVREKEFGLLKRYSKQVNTARNGATLNI